MNNAKPPEIALRFLRWFCPEHLLEEIEGDLIQKYEKDLKSSDHSKWSDDYKLRRAKRRLLWNVIRYFRPGIVLRNRYSIGFIQTIMFLNYLKTILRHTAKNKLNSFFKLGGLTLAILSLLIISIYVSYQFSFDRFHDQYENIYRVNSQRKENGQIEKFAMAPSAIGPMLQQAFPEVQSYVRIQYPNGNYIRYENKLTSAEGLIEADSSLFNVFTFKFIKGNKAAFNKLNSIVLTKTLAESIFGSTDVLQKIVSINNYDQLYEISAIIEDVPANSHLYFSAVIPFLEKENFTLSSITSPGEFVEHSSILYLRFREPIADGFTFKVEQLLDQYVRKSDREENEFAISFQRLKNIYLGPSLKYDLRRGSAIYVYTFSIFGFLLLVVAGINYTNLFIADYNSRTRETGIRKVLGARNYQVVTQLIIETLLFSITSLVLGLMLLYLLFPQIQQLLDVDLKIKMLYDGRVIGVLALGLFFLALISTYVPAYQFVTNKISLSLKSKGPSYKSSTGKALLFTQLTISIICICSTLMVSRQVDYIHNKQLGFEKSNLLVLSLPEDFTTQEMQVLKHSLKGTTGIVAVSNSSFRIGGGYWKDWYYVESGDEMMPIELYEVFSDDELFSTLNIKILSGRTFDALIPSDSGAAFVINETAARKLGWADPLGKRIYTVPEEKGKWDGTIVGVVADINISPLYEKIEPLVMRLPWQNNYPEYFLYVRFMGDPNRVIKSIEQEYSEVHKGYPLAYRFVDELYNSRHLKEMKVFNSLQIGSTFIIVISMLGIFSLASFISVRRMKEFGIRKILGATILQIIKLHMSYFIPIVILSNLIALPITFWMMSEWLNSFAYRVELTYLPFLVVGFFIFLLVILSTGHSSWKAGNMNPVDVIKIQ